MNLLDWMPHQQKRACGQALAVQGRMDGGTHSVGNITENTLSSLFRKELKARRRRRRRRSLHTTTTCVTGSCRLQDQRRASAVPTFLLLLLHGRTGLARCLPSPDTRFVGSTWSSRLLAHSQGRIAFTKLRSHAAGQLSHSVRGHWRAWPPGPGFVPAV